MNDFKKYAAKHLGINSLTLDRYAKYHSNVNNGIIFNPSVIEESKSNIMGLDIFSRLLMDRVIFLRDTVENTMATIIQAQLLYLESVEPGKDISMYINSPGGVVYDGYGIYDTMQFISSKVSTICTGVAASMAAVLLVAGEQGKRHALKHSRVMIHQPLGGVQGQASDIEITAREILKMKKEIYSIISEHSGQPYEKVLQDGDRDFWMSADEALEYGMIDSILTKKNG